MEAGEGGGWDYGKEGGEEGEEEGNVHVKEEVLCVVAAPATIAMLEKDVRCVIVCVDRSFEGLVTSPKGLDAVQLITGIDAAVLTAGVPHRVVHENVKVGIRSRPVVIVVYQERSEG